MKEVYPQIYADSRRLRPRLKAETCTPSGVLTENPERNLCKSPVAAVYLSTEALAKGDDRRRIKDSNELAAANRPKKFGPTFPEISERIQDNSLGSACCSPRCKPPQPQVARPRRPCPPEPLRRRKPHTVAAANPAPPEDRRQTSHRPRQGLGCAFQSAANNRHFIGPPNPVCRTSLSELSPLTAGKCKASGKWKTDIGPPFKDSYESP